MYIIPWLKLWGAPNHTNQFLPIGALTSAASVHSDRKVAAWSSKIDLRFVNKHKTVFLENVQHAVVWPMTSNVCRDVLYIVFEFG